MKPVLIETPRLLLEPFAERHLSDRYVSWLSDPAVVRWSDNRFREHTRESCIAYVQSFAGTPHTLHAIVARDPVLGHVGNISVHVDQHHGTADVGILIGERSAWGRGLGGEAWEAMVRHLLDSGVRKVTGGCAAENVAMVRIMLGAGMVEDGRRVRHAIFDGRPVDVVHFAAFAGRPE